MLLAIRARPDPVLVTAVSIYLLGKQTISGTRREMDRMTFCSALLSFAPSLPARSYRSTYMHSLGYLVTDSGPRLEIVHIPCDPPIVGAVSKLSFVFAFLSHCINPSRVAFLGPKLLFIRRTGRHLPSATSCPCTYMLDS